METTSQNAILYLTMLYLTILALYLTFAKQKFIQCINVTLYIVPSYLAVWFYFLELWLFLVIATLFYAIYCDFVSQSF